MGQSREKLPPPALLLLKKLRLLGGVLWKHCRSQVGLRNLKVKASRDKEALQRDRDAEGGGTAWARHWAKPSHQPSPCSQPSCEVGTMLNPMGQIRSKQR